MNILFGCDRMAPDLSGESSPASGRDAQWPYSGPPALRPRWGQSPMTNLIAQFAIGQKAVYINLSVQRGEEYAEDSWLLRLRKNSSIESANLCR